MSRTNLEPDLLGLSDAVLALSLSTINLNLHLMLQEDVISKKWIAAWVEGDPEKETKDFLAERNVSREEVERWVELRNQMAEFLRQGKYTQFAEVAGQITTDYTGAWNATIAYLEVEAMENVNDRVLLKVVFEEGQLYAGEQGGIGVKSYQLNGCVYAFETVLHKLPVKVDSMLPNAGQAAHDFIVKSELKSEDFSIESIFMDLQRSNIANFSAEKSVLPANAGAGTLVAASVSTMINKIMSEDETRKFILGYAVQQKQLKQVDEALFQPTSIHYSVSYAAPLAKGYPSLLSSFNFHMQVDGGAPMLNQYLPETLLAGHDIDEDNEVDGVFGLRYSLFEKGVLDKLVRESIKEIAKGLEFHDKQITEPRPGLVWKLQATQKWKDQNLEFSLRSGLFGKAHRHVTRRLHVEGSVDDKDGVLTVSFVIHIVQKHKYTAFRITSIGDIFTGGTANPTILETEVSTYGNGTPGKVQVLIRPGELGKLMATNAQVQSELVMQLNSFDRKKHFNDAWDAAEHTIGTLKNTIRDKVSKAKENIDTEFTKKVNDQMKSALSFAESVSALNVVMPLGNLYSFKELALRENSAPDGRVLTATLGYNPVEKVVGEE